MEELKQLKAELAEEIEAAGLGERILMRGMEGEDVALMRANCPPRVKVKAAGGISSLQDAEDFIDLGAERLGTSRIVKLAIAQEQETAPAQEPEQSY